MSNRLVIAVMLLLSLVSAAYGQNEMMALNYKIRIKQFTMGHLPCDQPIEWAPDGTFLAFMEYAHQTTQDFHQPMYQIEVRDSNGQFLWRSKASRDCSELFMFSPDGSKIAYTIRDKQREVVVSDSKTGAILGRKSIGNLPTRMLDWLSPKQVVVEWDTPPMTKTTTLALTDNVEEGQKACPSATCVSLEKTVMYMTQHQLETAGCPSPSGTFVMKSRDDKGHVCLCLLTDGKTTSSRCIWSYLVPAHEKSASAILSIPFIWMDESGESLAQIYSFAWSCNEDKFACFIQEGYSAAQHLLLGQITTNLQTRN
jgi:hypothetical protein